MRQVSGVDWLCMAETECCVVCCCSWVETNEYLIFFFKDTVYGTSIPADYMQALLIQYWRRHKSPANSFTPPPPFLPTYLLLSIPPPPSCPPFLSYARLSPHPIWPLGVDGLRRRGRETEATWNGWANVIAC